VAEKKKGGESTHNPADKARPAKRAAAKPAANVGTVLRGAPKGGRIRVKQVRSLSGRPDKHRRTIEALGLRYTQHTVEHDDTPAVRGMIQQVIHLLNVEPVE
jgi:large subunit ribosomal protein L30